MLEGRSALSEKKKEKKRVPNAIFTIAHRYFRWLCKYYPTALSRVENGRWGKRKVSYENLLW